MLEGIVTHVDHENCTFCLENIGPRPVSAETVDLEHRIEVRAWDGKYTVPLSYLWAVEE